jgi:hypothetical protein
MESEKITEQQALDALEAFGWYEDEENGGLFPPSVTYYMHPTAEQTEMLKSYVKEINRQFALENKFAPYQKD